MKKYIQILYIIIALGFAASCNDALELEYDGRSSLDELFKTRNGVRGYLNSCYGARIMPDINRSTLTDESQSSEMVFQGSLASLWYVDAFSATNYSNVDGQPWSENLPGHSPGVQHLPFTGLKRVTANELASLEERTSPQEGTGT